MDSTNTTSGATNDSRTRAERAITTLRQERDATLKVFVGLSETDLKERIDWGGSRESVQRRILAFTGHLIDHQQHLLRLLFARGRGISSAEYLWMKAAAEMAEFEVMCLALSDDDFTARGPVEGDWSAEQILEHVTWTERSYRERILAGLEAAHAARAAGDGQPAKP
jgi:uncharacterized damage-inducible protein DinB